MRNGFLKVVQHMLNGSRMEIVAYTVVVVNLHSF
jgi:hypothetical protein